MLEGATLSVGPSGERVSIDLGFQNQSEVVVRGRASGEAGVEGRQRIGVGAKVRFRNCRLWLAAMHRNAPDAVGVSGLRYVLHPNENRCRRLGWIIVLTCAIVVLTVQVLDRVVYYSSFPLSVKNEIDHRIGEVVFPKVVICNLNTFVKDVAEKNPALNELLLAHQKSIFHPDASTNLSQETVDELRLMNTSAVLVDVAHQPEDMFVMIRVGDKELSLSNVTYVHTNYGVCYQLNDGLHGHDVLTAKRAGNSFGMSLILNAEQDKYYYGYTNQYSAGFLLQLLDQEEQPMVAEFGFAIGPGTENFITLRALEEANIKPPNGICGEKQLKYYRKYSRTKCEMECLADVTVGECGCRMPHMPGNGPVCDPLENLKCATYKILSSDSIHELAEECDCPIDCQSKTYDYSLSSAKYPSLFWADELAAHINAMSPENTSQQINETYFANNIAAVNLFFMDISVTRISQQAAYSFFALLADIGGSMGLWLGGSLLTFYEVCDLCGYSFFSYRRTIANNLHEK